MKYQNKPARWLLPVLLFCAGAVSLLIPQFWLIVHFLWSEPILKDAVFWALGIAALLAGYFLLCRAKDWKRFPKAWEHVYQIALTLLTLTVLGIGIVTPSFFVLAEKQGSVLPDTVPEQHIPVEWAVTRSAHPGAMTVLRYTTPVFDESGEETGKTAEKRLRILSAGGLFSRSRVRRALHAQF